MIVAGIDVGALYVKTVILGEGKILAQSAVISSEEAAVASKNAFEYTLQQASLSPEDIAFVVSTGVGRGGVPFANKQSAEVVCQARGAAHLFPSAGMVLNLGAESSRAVRINEQGKAESFSTNDKCAAGSGLFLETMSRILEVPLEKMGDMALGAKRKEEVSSMCAVFAESEVISHIHRGIPKDEILAGVHKALAERILEIVGRVGVKPDIVASGGVARDPAIIRELEDKLDLKILVPDDPQTVGALGAALLAEELANGK